jgi:hypothetical protein
MGPLKTPFEFLLQYAGLHGDSGGALRSVKGVEPLVSHRRYRI